MQEVDLSSVALHGVVGVLPFVLMWFLLLYGYKYVADKITPYDDTAELQNGNFAVGLDRGGAFLGVSLASFGGLILQLQHKGSYWDYLWMFAVDGLVAAALFLGVCTYVMDKIIFWKVENSAALRDGNWAIALVHFSIYFGLGVLMCVSFSGGGNGFWIGLLSAVLFSVVGLIVFVMAYMSYALWRKQRGHSVNMLIRGNDMAIAIDVCSLMCAMGTILLFVILSRFHGLATNPWLFGVTVVVNVLIVTSGRFVSSYVLAGESRPAKGEQYESNCAQSLLVGVLTVCIAILVGIASFLLL